MSEARAGYRFALGAYVFWGLSPLYWHLLASVPALQVTAHRLIWTLPIVVGLTVVWQRRSLRSLIADRRVALMHLGAGLLLGTNWLVYVLAVTTDRVVDASLGYFINPLVSVLLGLVVLREQMSRPAVGAVTVAVVGVAILTWQAGTVPWISLTLAITFGVYGLLRKMSPLASIEGLTLEVLWMVPAAAAYLGWLVLSGSADFGDGAAPWVLWLVGAFTAIPLLMFASGARRVPLWTVGLLQYVAPTLQFFVGYVVFGERVTGLRWAGFGVIWLALAIFASSSVFEARRAPAAVLAPQ